jgi:uncharacterized protein (TIGR00251 family)
VSHPWYHWQAERLVLQIRVQPRASRDEIVGPLGDSLKVRLCAPPIEGKANAALLRFLATAFGVPARRVTLMSGAGSRLKQVAIEAPATLIAGIAPPPVPRARG